MEAAGEYDGLLDVVADLVSSDFSRASEVRNSLRARLLGDNAAEGNDFDDSATRRSLRRVRLLVAPVVAVLAVAIVAVASPGAITAAASQMEGFVQELVLGKNTTVAQIGSGEVDPARSAIVDDIFSDRGSTIWISKSLVFDGDQHRERTELPGSGRTFASFYEAQPVAGFRLRQSGYLSPGYELRNIRLTATGWAIATFFGPGGIILLAQVPGESGSEGATTTEIEVLTDRPIAEVSINGQPAAWVERRSLSWVDGDVSYTLVVNGLSLDEAMRIVRFLH